MKIQYTISIILILLLLTACKPSTTVTSITNKPQLQFDIRWQDLRWFITKDNKIIADYDIFADSYYTIVDEAFFTNTVLNQFDNFLIKNNINLAITNKNDCDKFARGFSFFSRVKSIQCADIQYSMPVADFYYNLGFDKSHAINIAIVLDNITNQKKLLFIEPQTKSIIDTTLGNDITNILFLPKFIGM